MYETLLHILKKGTVKAMNIGYDEALGVLTVPAATLASFARRRIVGRSNMLFDAVDDDASELPGADDGGLVRTREEGGFKFEVRGTSDGISHSGDMGILWKCFPVQRIFNGITPYTYPQIAAEAVVVADILCSARGWKSV
jgi:hypothetical protein